MKQQRRKRHYISLIAFFILALLFSSFSTGISAQEPAVKIWPFPEDLPEQYKSSDFSISAEGLCFRPQCLGQYGVVCEF